MSVSDESAGNGKKPRKGCVFLKPSQWVAARHQYESEPCKPERSIERLMLQYNVSERTIRKKIAVQNWRKGEQIADDAADKLHQLIDAKLPAKADAIVERLSKKVEDDLAPWFERQKRKHSKNAIRIVKKRQRMIESMVDSIETLTPKDSAYIAKADDTYDNMNRRNLGMNEGSGLGGSLSIQVLTNQAAVQVSQK